MLKKVFLHLIHSNSFSTKKNWQVFKFDHRWCTTLILKKLVRLAKNGVSQEYIGPLILEKIQMYILTRAELLYPLCHEIPCKYMICKISNFIMWTAKHFGQASCTELTLWYLHLVPPFNGSLKINPSHAAKASSEDDHEDFVSSFDLSRPSLKVI